MLISAYDSDAKWINVESKNPAPPVTRTFFYTLFLTCILIIVIAIADPAEPLIIYIQFSLAGYRNDFM